MVKYNPFGRRQWGIFPRRAAMHWSVFQREWWLWEFCWGKVGMILWAGGNNECFYEGLQWWVLCRGTAGIIPLSGAEMMRVLFRDGADDTFGGREWWIFLWRATLMIPLAGIDVESFCWGMVGMIPWAGRNNECWIIPSLVDWMDYGMDITFVGRWHQ